MAKQQAHLLDVSVALEADSLPTPCMGPLVGCMAHSGWELWGKGQVAPGVQWPCWWGVRAEVQSAHLKLGAEALYTDVLLILLIYKVEENQNLLQRLLPGLTRCHSQIARHGTWHKVLII